MMRRSRNVSELFAVAAIVAPLLAFGAAAPATIPLCPGLTIVTAINQPEGDYESIKTIESIDAKGVRLKYSAERRIQDPPGSPPKVRKLTMYRTILSADLQTATLYLQQFQERAPATVPGTTAVGTSSRVLRALKTNGESSLGIFDELPPSELSADPNTHPSVLDYRTVEKIQRVATVTVPITVNGAQVPLPAIHARGDYTGDRAEFFFLDDERNPMALKFSVGSGASQDKLQVVKVAYRCSGAPLTTALEEALLKTGRIDVYDIYFSFNSDEIRQESKPTLDEIVDVARRHPEWKLAIEGHTDSIGSDGFNLDLSKRRSAAVKVALAAGGIDGNRLATTGFGESQPQDTNDTLEGRARNRRVTLVRQ